MLIIAGVIMINIAITDLMPEAVIINKTNSMLYMLTGFALMTTLTLILG